MKTQNENDRFMSMRSGGIDGDGWPIGPYVLLNFFLAFLIFLVIILNRAVELLFALLRMNIEVHHVNRNILHGFLKILQFTLNGIYLFPRTVETKLGRIKLHHGTVKLAQCQVHFLGMYIAEDDEC